MKGAGGAALSVSLTGCQSIGGNGGTGNGNNNGQNGDVDGSQIPDEPVELAFFGFQSGPASVFGVPFLNAARLIVDEINSNGGILGERKINASYYDEAAGTGQMVSQVRSLKSQGKADAVIGFISSGNMLAVAPVAESIGQLTLFGDAGSYKLFEENPDPKFIFRPYGGHLSVGSAGAAQLIAKNMPDVKRVAGINQDYAWGHDAMRIFREKLKALRPDIEIVADRYSKFPSTKYTSHITALKSANPDLVFTSHWGGGLVALIRQAASQGLTDQAQFVSNCGEHMLQQMGNDIPEGLLVGARGPYYHEHHPNWPMNDAFVSAFHDRFDSYPIYPSYHMRNTIMAYVGGVERAYNLTGKWPSQEQVATALESGSGYQSPTGFVSMPGHQGKSSGIYGYTTLSQEDNKDFATLTDRTVIPADQVNPPQGMNTEEWAQN